MGLAHRLGYERIPAYQLKVIQEAITLVVFAFFYLGEAPRWNYIVAFGCILAAVILYSWH